METVCPSMVGSLVRIWITLHKDLDVALEPADAQYLRCVLFGMNDELIASLLGAKLAMSGERADPPAGPVVRAGSDVVFSIAGERCRAQLVHGEGDAKGRLGTATRFGAALLGIQEGASLLWPQADGRLVDVCAIEVTNSICEMRPQLAAEL